MKKNAKKGIRCVIHAPAAMMTQQGKRIKTGKRILSYILVLALSVSLLSGCSQADRNGQTGTESKHNEAIEKRREAVQSAGAILAGQTEETEKLLEELDSMIVGQNTDEAASLVETLSEKLSETEEQTENWLAVQQEMTKGLSGKAADVLEGRKKSFKQELTAGGKEADEILKTLGDAIEKGDMKTARAEAGQLEELLVDKEEPKTYGDTLPNEVEVQEAGEEKYTEPADSAKAGDSQDDTGFGEEIKKAEGDTSLNDSITAKAEELGTPLAIYNYLKNNIGCEYYYGSRKGAAGTMDAMGGNDLDQASLLIAMLRHLGYPAKYVKGDILLTKEQALSLTGADTFRHAADVLAAAGTPVTCLTKGEEIVYIRVEHVWVRAYVPYTDYRGAGNAGGESLWIDLDTSIKEYEAVDNIYDTLDEQGFPEAAQTITKGGDTAQIESLLNQWEEKLQSEDLSETYARKRIIKKEEVSYLPLSLQYMVEKEIKTFAQVEASDKDRVSFEVNGDVLAGFAASDLQGKNILLSFRPASDADQEIYDHYSSIFDIPAYAVNMKPVLLVDNEVVAEGEEYLESTLGTRGNFTIDLTSGGKNTSVTNEIKTGSMYAVTLDGQNITAGELQSVYDEAAVLKDSVTEENVYSEEYLGKMLAFAGRLYFAQVDIADTIAADMYDVSVTRSLSEGITGYEVRTSSLYGRITSLSEGSLYIDVDSNSHSVVSLNGKADVPREYMMSTGMVSSLYESTVWEQITGYESVSTISILAKAQEENIDILLISSANLDTEIEKLNTDDTTKQTVINAVNSGKTVTIPAKNVAMNDWYGTGYIVTNPETGAGAYMISGGLNGGALTVVLTVAVLCAAILLIYAMNPVIEMIIGLGIALFSGMLAPIGTVVVLAKLIFWSVALIGIFDQWCDMFEAYNQYLQTGNLDAADSAAQQARIIGYFSLVFGLAEKYMQKVSIVEKAKAWQTSPDYPNADDWIEITLRKGDTIWGGTPGQSNFYTSNEVMNEVGKDATKLYEGLQVGKNGYPQYREFMTQYIVKEDITVAYSKALANPQYGAGGYEQFFIDKYEQVLEAIKTVTMENR